MKYDELKDRLVFKDLKGEPAAPPKLVEVLYEPYICEGCGTTLDKRRIVDHRIVPGKNTEAHISEQCRNCKMFKNPLTGKFDCTAQQKNAILRGDIPNQDK